MYQEKRLIRRISRKFHKNVGNVQNIKISHKDQSADQSTDKSDNSKDNDLSVDK
jgi:hypothetical protein